MPEVLMPRLSDTMEEGTLSQWVKHQGDQVRRGEVMAVIETDKAAMDLEAYDDGVLSEVLVDEGASVPIGTPIAVIDGRPGGAPPPAPSRAARVPTSPLARALARRHGIDLAGLTGSGPGGRVVRADVEEAVHHLPAPAAAPRPQPPPAEPAPAPAADHAADHLDVGPDIEELPLSQVRRITAERLSASARQAPHFYLTRVVDADRLAEFRAGLNARPAAEVKVSLTDLLVKACAAALARHREVNSSWSDRAILRHRRVHVGVAVAIEEGLVVPVVRDADRKTLTEIAREAHDLAARARARRLTPAEISGSTFSISNLGMYGIDHFTAVINPPEAAILAVGAVTRQPVARGEEIVIGQTMTLTLSIDHRVVDGAAGAAFLDDLVKLIEDPLSIVV